MNGVNGPLLHIQARGKKLKQALERVIWVRIENKILGLHVLFDNATLSARTLSKRRIMLRIHLVLSLFLITLPSFSWCMQNTLKQLPLMPMHNAEQVIQKFNYTLVLYAATTSYLTGFKNEIYPTDVVDAGLGFVSPRSTSWNYQPNVVATYSIKKLMPWDEWIDDTYAYEGDPESLLTNWSVYEGDLTMRAANQAEINSMCQVWCPDNYDFDYEEWTDIYKISDKYCCPEKICCAPDKKKLMRYVLRTNIK